MPRIYQRALICSFGRYSIPPARAAPLSKESMCWVRQVSVISENRRKASYVVAVLDPASGQRNGAVLVDTGNLSFKVRSAVTAGDTIMVTDSEDRTLVYSLKTGMQKGRVFGNIEAVSADGTKMLVEYGRGEVDLYETSNLQSLAHFTFPAPMVHAEFAADGKTMRILTADQLIYKVKAVPAEPVASVH